MIYWWPPGSNPSELEPEKPTVLKGIHYVKGCMRPADAKKASDIRYPVHAYPEIEGFRCLIQRRQAVSGTLKPIKNRHLRRTLAQLPDGLDGKILVSNGISVMDPSGEPEFTFLVHDYFGSGKGYLERILYLIGENYPDWVKILKPKWIRNEKELFAFEDDCMSMAFKGIILRDATAPYKEGRCTLKEGNMLRWSNLVRTSHARIIGFVEDEENEIIKSLFVEWKGIGFFVEMGISDELKKDMWDKQEYYDEERIVIRFQPSRGNDCPRFAVFEGFVNEDL